uniref:Haloacid dehalogenase superfamily, subfamily IA, variant 3 with third motif having DD or ED/haloacid dehalogenase superfamily, subfamily IA, variant 1 with third motif having Dx(3-4)D or Dx(3-4)E n=1 Tax=Candidatus Kentrum sp. SD TaxID=2126332 RepID=A0A450Z0U1_9GAMM|nr:MAG: haloacid dehalogenase superfamily, subfamily IA, variant 3 with third motif having DD or ED/haloacid dehalogenase superfamily, subfamily IA, variant 1 with third motif having Dx(3-4)D or Dx(3-4)E [Candidatus Kentron sp. SD]
MTHSFKGPFSGPLSREVGILWDLDGTLFDSGKYHITAWEYVLGAENISIGQARLQAFMGQNNASTIRGIWGRQATPRLIEHISARKEERYRHLIRTNPIHPLPGVEETLDRFSRFEWKQAIASSAPRKNIELVLSRLGIAHFFQAIVGEEDVRFGKPDPEVFMMAATRLRVRDSRCIVIEDSISGIEAARRAAMACVRVGGDELKVDADLCIERVDQLTRRIVFELLAKIRSIGK